VYLAKPEHESDRIAVSLRTSHHAQSALYRSHDGRNRSAPPDSRSRILRSGRSQAGSVGATKKSAKNGGKRRDVSVGRGGRLEKAAAKGGAATRGRSFFLFSSSFSGLFNAFRTANGARVDVAGEPKKKDKVSILNSG